MDQLDWLAWVREYNAMILASHDLTEWVETIGDHDLERAVKAGWLGFPGATEEELARTEARLGVPLPLSYRSFLRASNGWWQPDLFVPRLWTTEELSWFRHTGGELIEIYEEIWPEVADDMKRALRISEEGPGGELYLLIPNSNDQAAEWRAWFVASWAPGFEEYDSFQNLIRQSRESFQYVETEGDRRMLPTDTLEQLPQKLPHLLKELEEQVPTMSYAGPLWQELIERVEHLRQASLTPVELLAALRALERDLIQARTVLDQTGTASRSSPDTAREGMGWTLVDRTAHDRSYAVSRVLNVLQRFLGDWATEGERP